MRRTSLVVVLSCLLGACALFPLSEAECKGVDWERKGYADGYSGAHQQYLRLSEECQRRYGVTVPEEAYFKGWRAGHDEWYRLIGSFDRRR